MLTGASGLLGGVLLPGLEESFECWPVGGRHRPAHPRGECVDLEDSTAVADLMSRVAPTVVVHLAALADVDLCEAHPERAYRANVLTTRNVCDAVTAMSNPARLIYISTDQVYDAAGDNDETAVQPRNTYALTKLWGEEVCRQLPLALILRLNFFANDQSGGRGLTEWLIESLRAGAPINLFADVHFNPIFAGHLVRVLSRLIEAQPAGTYNLGAAGGAISKAEFARRLARRLDLSTQNCREMSVADAALAAYRPRGMAMDVSRLEAVLGRHLPTIEDGLKDLVAERAEFAIDRGDARGGSAGDQPEADRAT